MQINGASNYHYTTQTNATNKTETIKSANASEESQESEEERDNSWMKDYVYNYLDEKGKAIYDEMKKNEQVGESSVEGLSLNAFGVVGSFVATNSNARFEEKYGRKSDYTISGDTEKLHEIIKNGEWTENVKGPFTFGAKSNLTELILTLGSGINAQNYPDSIYTKFAELYKSGYTPLNEEI